MNDTPAPFTFKAARPAAAQTPSELQKTVDDAVQLVEERATRVRRRRGPNKPKEQGEADELSCFLEIVNRLQALSPATRKRALAALQGLFG